MVKVGPVWRNRHLGPPPQPGRLVEHWLRFETAFFRPLWVNIPRFHRRFSLLIAEFLDLSLQKAGMRAFGNLAIRRRLGKRGELQLYCVLQ